MDMNKNNLIKSINNNNDFTKLMQTARNPSNLDKLRSIEFRKQQLRNLLRLYNEQEHLLVEALANDLSKPYFEAITSEVEGVKNEVHYALRNIDAWTKPKSAQRNLTSLSDEVYTVRKPYGLVLIIGPWNYPSYSTMIPLAGAIAAGNVAIIKPSEIASATGHFFAQMLPRYLDKECFQVIELDAEGTTALLREKFDYIFFVGSPTVGKIIYEAAAKQLTPVTLELGGKCPVYLNDDINIEYATKRLLWGKFFNAGQTCIAPDYVLCSAEMANKFIAQAKSVIKQFYGDDVISSKDFARIINTRNCKRLEDILSSTKGRIIVGGQVKQDLKFVEPTIVADVTMEDSLMKQEIFGPILPILIVNDFDHAIKMINSLPDPLVIYLFTEDKKQISRFTEETNSGTILVNDTLLHTAVNSLPFGGRGNSGIGRFLGKFTFETFSQERSMFIRNFARFEEISSQARYPPYTESNLHLLRDSLDNSNGLVPPNIIFVLYRVIKSYIYSFFK